MPLNLKPFDDPAFSSDYLAWLLDEQAPRQQRTCQRLWNYYRNPLLGLSAASAGAMNENARPYVLAQEVGLPARITGVQRVAGETSTDLRRKEVVIENDIAWRIQTGVDFLVNREITLRSRHEDPDRAAIIEQILNALFDANGGLALLQEMALLASVYGFVDVVLRIPADWPAHLRPAALSAGGPRPDASPSNTSARDGGNLPAGDRSKPKVNTVIQLAGLLRLETVDAPRVLPILAEDNYRQLRYWVQCYRKRTRRIDPPRTGWLRSALGGAASTEPRQIEVVEILSPAWWQRYENRDLVAEGPNALNRLPVVHIPNLPSPGQYGGLSDVEPLIPLQDELNTRLSDRAHRVTYQSFKMYLGKGIDDFLERPVGPGQMWATQNPDAGIEEFGRDEGSPSENIHIDQIRTAMDKASAVTPLAAGLVRDQLGQLTSAAALRVVLSSLLSKTARKQRCFAAGLKQIAALALDWLDRSGAFPNRPHERNIDIHLPDPLPENDTQRLANARLKQQLGVPRSKLLAELGYDPSDSEVTE
jgi:hypothetical protein